MNANFYIGDFLIEIFANIESYKDVYGNPPHTIAVDSEHYKQIAESGYDPWIDAETMKLMNGVQIVKEDRYNGSFMSMRSNLYAPWVG